MCTNEDSFHSILDASVVGKISVAPPYGLAAVSSSKLTVTTEGGGGGGGSSSADSVSSTCVNNKSITSPPTAIVQPFDHYRLHLYNYALHAERLRFVQQNYAPPMCPPPTLAPFAPRWAFPMSLLHHRLQPPDEPKPQHSYIGLIALAILSSAEVKLVLSDIYQYILDNYPYFRTRGPGWRNSIRHNLSLNDCFVKAGRSANGKGHYWSIHPANIDDFRKGDFRRRKAQRKVRKHMGLSVDDDGNDSPSPPPITPPPPALWSSGAGTPIIFPNFHHSISRKRQFDVASLLEPDEDPSAGTGTGTGKRIAVCPASSSSEEGEDPVDVVTSSDCRINNDGCLQNASPSAIADSSLQNSTFGLMGPWNYQPIAIGADHCNMMEQHQLMTKAYYEQLSARTVQIGLYQQWQLQKRNNLQKISENPD